MTETLVPPEQGSSHALVRKVFFNTAIQLVARFLGVAVSVVTFKLTTNYLGVGQFGQLSIVLAFADLLRVLADLGVGTTLARELAKSPGDADVLGGSLLRIRLAGTTGAILLALAVVPVLPYEHETKLALAAALVGVFFMSAATFPNAFFQTNLRLELQAALELATRFLNLALIAVVIAFDGGLYGVIASFVLVNAIVCLAAFWLSRPFWRLNVRFERRRASPLVRDAIAIGVVSMIGLLHFKGDAVLLSLLKPAKDVGVYAVAYRFIDYAFILPGLFVAAMFPILTRAIHRSPREGEVVINKTFQVLLLGAVPVTLGLVVLARPLIRIITSAEFDAAVTPLRILAFSLILIFVNPVFYNALIAVNRQRELIAVGIASVVFNVALNLVLIPRYSYDGAAIATLISEGVSCLGAFVIARRRLGFELDVLFLPRVLLAVTAAAGAAAATWRVSEWVAFVAAELAFALAAYATGAVTRADLRMVLRRAQA